MLVAFWFNFWPNFAATIIAVIAGIPAGLWLDRRAERSAARARAVEQEEDERRQRTEQRERTCSALQQLEPVIRAHAPWFKILGSWGNLNEFHEGPMAEPWLVVRAQIAASLLHDRSLLGDLAVHFERCLRMDELVRLRSSFAITGVSAQHQRVLTEEEAIKTRLNNMRNAEGADPTALADRVAAEVDRLHSAEAGGATTDLPDGR